MKVTLELPPMSRHSCAKVPLAMMPIAALSEFMEWNQPAFHVSLRICGKKTKETPF
jgi:hypothetical protein